MTAPLLEVDGLTVRFDTEEGPVHSVDGLSFSLAPGEVLGVVGESGCGKTTACLALVRLLPETAAIGGRVALEGRDLLSLPARKLRLVRAREIAYVFQEPLTALNPVLTVETQITEMLRAHLGLSRPEARERAIALLRLVHIPVPEKRLASYPHQLSGGMRQRVVIAMALACGPKVLIADEPTTALDVTIQAEILDLLHNIRAELGTAIVLITHNLGVVADLADRVLVMYAGREVEEAPVVDLFAAPQHPYTAGLLAAVPRVHEGGGDRERLQEIPGRIPTLRERARGCAFVPRCAWATGSCTTVPPLRAVRERHLVACVHPGSA